MATSEEGKTFGKIGGLYDRSRVGYPEQLIGDIINYSGTKSGHVLDIGCGSGQITIPFARSGCSVIGLDISQEMINLLKSKCSSFSNVGFRVGTFEDVKLDTESLDIVTSGMAWHWVSPEKRMKKVYKILKTGGTVALSWSYQHREQSDFVKNVSKVLDKYGGVNRGPTGSRVPDIANRVYQEFKESKLFTDIEIKGYSEDFAFTKQRYIDLVTSYGWVQVLSEEKRIMLIKELREMCNKYHEPLIIPYKYVLVLARKLRPSY